jgi:hypothetical protein
LQAPANGSHLVARQDAVFVQVTSLKCTNVSAPFVAGDHAVVVPIHIAELRLAILRRCRTGRTDREREADDKCRAAGH